MRNTTPVSVITVNDGSVTMRTEKEMAGIPTPFRCDLLICGSAWMDLKVGCRKIKYFSKTDRQHVCPVSASAEKLELHLLGNHYLENLKAVMLGALYFKEPGIYAEYKSRLQEELKEQILPDGVHYERSIMYHKIVLEDVMRATKGVKDADQLFYQELSALLQPMTDAMYSLEEGMGHPIIQRFGR